MAYLTYGFILAVLMLCVRAVQIGYTQQRWSRLTWRVMPFSKPMLFGLMTIAALSLLLPSSHGALAAPSSASMPLAIGLADQAAPNLGSNAMTSVAAGQTFENAIEASALIAPPVAPSANGAASPLFQMSVTYDDAPASSIAIPDNDCGSGDIVRTFSVTENFTVQQIRLGINIDHEFRSDLVIRLTAPDGTSSLIVDLPSSDVDNFDVLLDDFSPNPLEDNDIDDTSAPLYDRTAFPPVPFFSRLYGVNSQGTWQLTVCDDGSGDIGSYNSARLILDDTPLPISITGIPDCNGGTIYLKDSDIAAIPAGGSIALTDRNGDIDDGGAPMCHFNGTTSETHFCLDNSKAVCSSYYVDGLPHLFAPNPTRPDITDVMRAQITWLLEQWALGSTITGNGQTLDLTTSDTLEVQQAIWCLLGQNDSYCPVNSNGDNAIMADAAATAIPDAGSIPAAPTLSFTRTSAASVTAGSTQIFEMTTNQGTVNLSVSDGGDAPFLCDASGNAISDPDITVTATTFTDTGISGTETYNLCLIRSTATSVTLSTSVVDRSGDSFTPLFTSQLTPSGSECQDFLRISDFELEAPTEAAWTPLRSIGDTVWFDANSDGDQDTNELGVAGITVNLLNSGGTVINTTTTDSYGFYQFTTDSGGVNLPAGDYEVEFVLPVNSNLSFTTADQAGGDDTLDSDANTTTGRTGTFNVTTGTDDTRDAGLILPASCAVGNDLGGNVFRDYNANGTDDGASEPPYPGPLTINAYDDNNMLVASTVVQPGGTYNFPNLFASYSHLRLEFSGLPSWARSSATGTNSGTTVQHHGTSTCTADLAVQNPAEYCESAPDIAAACFVNGDPLGTPPADPVDAVNLLDTVVTFAYNASGTSATINSTGVAEETGSIWGLAHNPATDQLFMSAVLKRHVGLGPDGLGAIYVSNPYTATPSLFTVLPDVGSIADNGTRGLVNVATSASRDPDAYTAVGTVGIGDIDLSEDGSLLYAMNLAQRRVDVINTTTLAVTSLPALPDPGCTAGIARPWALKVRDGNVYAGMVCSGESGGSQANLSAHVYAYNGSSWSSVVAFDLDYPRDCAYTYQSDQTGCQGWQPWIDQHSDITSNFIFGGGFFAHPTPILSDIEFDHDGSMILAFIDRTALQYGTDNLQPNTSDNTSYALVSGGELLRVHNLNGNFVLENNGAGGDPTTAGQNNGSGPGPGPDATDFGEYYFEDIYHNFSDDDEHNETTLGGIAMRPGFDDIVVTVLDPEANSSDGDDNLNTGGINWYDNVDGTRQQSLRLYQGGAPYFAKAQGLGDVELICAAAPLQIGNYVWLDNDGDGVQDPSESGLAGVTVRLTDSNGVFTDTVTNLQGEYYFNVQPTRDYTITISLTQTNVSGYSLTTANVVTSSSTLPDSIDSDGIEVGATAVITLTTGNAGENDHSFDFGFIQFDYGDLPEGPYDTTIASGGASHVIDGVTYLGSRVDAEADGQPMANADGDDAAGAPDDEDGVVFNTPIIGGEVATITVTASITGYLNTWIDFDGSGTLVGGEHIFNDVQLVPGSNVLTFTAPTSIDEEVYSRFRFTAGSGQATSPSGAAPNGEVEDYLLLSLGDTVWYDANNDALLNNGENGIAGVTVTLVLSGTTTPLATTTTDGSGEYGFTGLAEGDYQVIVGSENFQPGAPLAGHLSSSGDNSPEDTVDDEDTGIDPAAIGDYLTAGVTSNPVSLNAGTEPTTDGNGNNSNLTVDFGFTAYDWGDLPDPTYNTNRVGTVGPNHLISDTLYLGSSVDAETDGQPNATATGDDNATTPDDEDGIALPTNITAGQTALFTATVVNTNNATATLYGFIDWNGDGDFDDLNEATTQPANSAGSVTLSFSVPVTATTGSNLGARFRLSTDGALGADGSATDGEVEDYLVTVTGYDLGDAPNTYSTTLAASGARHQIDPTLYLGSLIDPDGDGQPNTGATGDDSDTQGDDEDGVSFGDLIVGRTATITVTASTTGTLDAWLDFNDDGSWTEAADQIFSGQALVPGQNVLTFTVPATATITDETYARFRLSSAGVASYSGDAPDGEVEDYAVAITGRDYGDLPDTFDTTDAQAGAYHVITHTPTIYLGSRVDAEGDGQVSPNADADDTNIGVGLPINGDDEDGVTLPSILVPGQVATITVSAVGSANFSAWIDFNADGDFDADERVHTNTPLTTGSTVLSVTVPTTATGGSTVGARFRYTSDTLTSHAGSASDGEVEDYRVNIAELDFGDLPDSGSVTGYATQTYPTRLVDDGPRHVILTANNPTLGSLVDDEPDGQPSLRAAGDDASGAPDDEEGVTFAGALVPGETTSITVTASGANGNLSAWIDFNGNGSFDANEQIASDQAIVAGGNVVLSVSVPVTATQGITTYSRFRFSSDTGLSPTGLATDGEIEDHPVPVVSLDYGDLLDDAVNHPTTYASGGPRHIIDPDANPILGSLIDNESDGQPTANANGDDNTATDDEDGVTLPAFVPGTTTTVTVQVSNPTSNTVYLNGWIDYDGDGDLDQLLTDQAVTAGFNSTIDVPVSTPFTATVGSAEARFRISSDSGLGLTGLASDGEVEDYVINIVPLDYGDLLSPYPTMFSDDGPRHPILPINPTLGSTIDDETNGQPNPNATGDDASGIPDDEDGVTFSSPLVPGETTLITVTATVTDGLLSAWVDFNGNGTLDDAGEQIATNQAIAAGSNAVLSVNVPLTATQGITAGVRFRFSTESDLRPTGLATDGEVEDYVQPILAVDYGDLPDGYGTTNAANGARHILDGNTYLGSGVDNDLDGAPSNIAAGDDTADGNDDEDGIIFLTPMMPGQTADIQITASSAGYLNAWIDFNGNGTLEAGERVLTDQNYATAGIYTETISVPATVSQTLYSRFRFSANAGEVTAPNGIAPSGEVEDYVLMSLGDTIWLDDGTGSFFNDGLLNGGETGVPGVTVTLVYSGSTTPLATTVTDGSGNYLFTGLVPGDYQVIVDPSNFQPSAPLDSHISSAGVTDPENNSDNDDNGSDQNTYADHQTNGVTSLPVTLSYGSEPNNNGNANLTVDLGFYPLTLSLGNLVWVDHNTDGIADADEPGIADVTVVLLQGGTPVQTTTTDATGHYQFNGLLPNDYQVQIVGSNFHSGGTLQPYSSSNGNGAVDSDIDNNDDGLDPADPMDYATDGVTSEPITLAFDSETVANQDGDGSLNTNLTVDFGFVPNAALGNYVWLDENSDGVQDAGEVGIPNIIVNLTDSAGNIYTTTTDAQGGYLFNNLVPGTYTVTVNSTSLPNGLSYTQPYGAQDGSEDFGNQDPNGYAVTLDAGESNLTADFGYNWNPVPDVWGDTNEAALGDRIWIDSDADGVQDPNEVGVEGVELTLYHDPDGDGLFTTVLSTTTTDHSGNYLFDALTPDAYVVAVTDSGSASHDVLNTTDYTQTGDPDHFGTTGSNNDNLSTTPIVLSPGDVFLNADFGYLPEASAPVGSIGDTVWLDEDASADDQTNQGPEPGIPGVSVSLIADLNGDGVWNAGEPIIATDLTDENGNYLFEGLSLDDGDGDADFIIWVNDTNNVLDGLVQTYDQEGPLDAMSHTAIDSGNPTDLDQDFSYTPQGNIAGQGLLGDTVWLDANGDGVQDVGELGISGVEVMLTFSDGTTLTTVTDSQGEYIFTNLPTSPTGETYTVTVNTNTLPAGLNQTFDDDGLGTPDQSVTSLTDSTPIDLDQDFGYVGNNSLGNLLWLDSNADGSYDADGADNRAGTDDDEPLIDGVTINLYFDSDYDGVLGSGDALISTATTDSSLTTTSGDDGNYLFTGLPDGVYFVHVSDQDGVLNGYWHSLGIPFTSNESQIDAYYPVGLFGNDDVTADFGYYVEPAALGNYVWEDLNGDGIQDVGEPAIPGVTVTLTIDYASGDTSTLVTTTDVNGHYSFANLLLDENHIGDGAPFEPTFTISAQTPTGYIPTTVDVGSDLSDSDEHSGVSAQPSQGQTDVSAQSPVSDEPTIASYDFGFAQPVTVGNLVWLDTNADGIQDSTETGLPNVTVSLILSGTGVVSTTTTDSQGIYTFTHNSTGQPLPPGEYAISVSPPAGYELSPHNQGSDDTADSDPDPNTGQSPFDLVPSGSHNPDFDTGLYLPVSIGDLVWLDEDADGQQDATETTGVSGVTVTLTLSGTGVVSTTTTDGNGNYLFTHDSNGNPLPPGTYIVTFTPPASYTISPQDQASGNDSADSDIDPVTSTTAPLTLSSGDNINTLDAGLYLTTGIGNFIWLDTNQDGIQDAGETGISGVTVTLSLSGTGVISTTTTDSDGFYQFLDLDPGNYFITVTPPAGYAVSPPNQGNDTDSDSDIDPVTGQTIVTYLDTGEVDNTWDGGLFQINPQLAIDKTVSLAYIAPNQVSVLTYTLTITNQGNIPLTSVNLTDTMDLGLSYIPNSASPAPTSVSGQTLLWDDVTGGTPLQPGQSTQVVLETAVTTAIGTYNNTGIAQALYDPGFNYPAGSTDPVTVTIPVEVADPAVELVKNVVAPGIVGNVITFSIDITNTGPSTLDVLPLFDTFSGPMIYVGGTPTADIISNTDQIIAWNDLTTHFGNIAPGQSIHIDTVFQITGTSNEVSLLNNARVTGSEDLLNNQANDTEDTVQLVNIPTAISLLSFDASPAENGILLSWQTAIEFDNFGFKLMRSDTDNIDDASEITFISGQGQGTNTGTSYTFLDHTAQPNHTYTYWLIDIDNNGQQTTHGPTSITALNTGGPASTFFLPFIRR